MASCPKVVLRQRQVAYRRCTGSGAMLPTMSLAGLSIWFMTGWWITLAFGLVALVLAALNVTLHWSSDSGAAALTGGSGVLLAFVVLGTLIENIVRNAAWVREDPGQLWLGIFTAFVCFTLGVLKAAPWVILGVLAERDGGAHSPGSLTIDAAGTR